jgi:aryl-alcohol dehydrogenase-like predicted oxidoreductase
MAKNPNCLAAQHQLHVFVPPDRWKKMLALCDEFDLASINRSPLMMGILTGKFTADSTFSEGEVRHSIGLSFNEGRLAERLKQVDDIREVLTSDGRTMVQGALARIASLENVTNRVFVASQMMLPCQSPQSPKINIDLPSELSRVEHEVSVLKAELNFS